ncbi:hypothetical protein FNW02_26830 [Komarekiella sp. 'clone 1']|uniref:Uncharacterized protein n=1 Tax=Komarekiella delphini-convector SJRDD-AB1 TaxID=2593771 RepID=A0AA40T2C8_9NOST|nr:hypothetical protein [Komarekiella delphini-convector]MBD6619344.1 hypothetical protein [Komarekiella delphini-convector SJRDD-AB1]
MSSSDKYKREIMNDLAHGNTESLDEVSSDPTKDYQNFDDFAQRSSHEERRQLFGRSLNHDRIPPSQMEPELQKAIAQIKPNERDDVARAFFKHLKERGLDDRHLERTLGLSTHHPNRMNADDVSKLAAFAYHNHPDIFQEVMAEQPAILKFLSNPVVGAALGAIAAKWFGGRK